MLVCCLLLVVNFLDPVNSQVGEKLSFKMPDMTDEEQHSEHVPYNLKCDACMAVAYQVYIDDAMHTCFSISVLLLI